MKFEPCRRFNNYKAIYAPKCNCVPCWFFYFEHHAGSTAAKLNGLDRIGAEAVSKVLGVKELKFLKLYREAKRSGGERTTT